MRARPLGHALRLGIGDLVRKLWPRPAPAQRQRVVAFVHEDTERIAHVRFVQPVFVLMPSVPAPALIDGVPGKH